MVSLQLHNLTLSVDFPAGHVCSVVLNGVERVCAPTPLFRMRLRDRNGAPLCLNTYDAKACERTEDGAVYTDFQKEACNVSLSGLSVRVRLTEENGEAAWRVSVTPNTDELLVEWIDFPMVTLPALSDNNPNGTGGEILIPYNEGALVSDWNVRQASALRYQQPEYPSLGSYAIFPNMICSQMLAYLWQDAGLYIGIHDTDRGVKGIDFLTAVTVLPCRSASFAAWTSENHTPPASPLYGPRSRARGNRRRSAIECGWNLPCPHARKRSETTNPCPNGTRTSRWWSPTPSAAFTTTTI